MKLLRGNDAGEDVTLHQFANDWMTVREYPSKVFAPSSFVLTPDEVARVRAADVAHLGFFWAMWHLDDTTGRFTVTEPWKELTGTPSRRVNARREGL